jgi:hypothetical protein
MSTRPCARFNGPGHRQDPAADAGLVITMHPRPPVSRRTAADRAASRARVRALALEIVRQRGEVYSAELADALGCSCSHAKGLLIGLELRGLVSSEHRQTTVSGHGRRYYRLRVEQP